MSIIGTIKNVIPTNPVSIATKAIGLAGLGYVGYDSHYIGKMQADLYSSEKDADAAAFYLNNSMYSTDMSKVSDNVKNASFQMELDQGWRRFFNSGIGYIQGFTSMLVNHVVPLGLSVGASLGGKISGGICAGGLGAYALGKFVKDFFGMGTPKGLNKGV